jgi:hypothetical protein
MGVGALRRVPGEEEAEEEKKPARDDQSAEGTDDEESAPRVVVRRAVGIRHWLHSLVVMSFWLSGLVTRVCTIGVVVASS